MEMNRFTLCYEELIGDVVALPGGRCVFAELELRASVPVGISPAEPDSVQLVVEVRATPEEEFKQAVISRELTESGQVRVQVPTRDKAYEFDEHVPVVRARVVHRGRMQQRFVVRFVGL